MAKGTGGSGRVPNGGHVRISRGGAGGRRRVAPGQTIHPAHARRLQSQGVFVPRAQINGSSANRRSNASFARQLAAKQART